MATAASISKLSAIDSMQASILPSSSAESLTGFKGESVLFEFIGLGFSGS